MTKNCGQSKEKTAKIDLPYIQYTINKLIDSNPDITDKSLKKIEIKPINDLSQDEPIFEAFITFYFTDGFTITEFREK